MLSLISNWSCLSTRPILIILFLVHILLSGCASPSDSYTIQGNGFIKIPDQTIYLIDAFEHYVIDSTKIQNGDFLFEINKNQCNQKLVSIKFNSDGKNSLLGFPTSKGYSTSFFMEKDITKMVLHERKDGFKNSISAEIIDGYENKIQYQYPNLMIPSDAIADIYRNAFQQIVSKYHDSEYVAGCLYSLRYHFEIDDYEKIYRQFSLEVRDAFYGQKISSFIRSVQENDKLVLQDSLWQEQVNVDRKKSLNMLVFWATWCTPCIKEIPQVKHIYEKYKSENFSISSISIDTDSIAWLRFVRNRNDISWPQYILPSKENDVISYKFGITGVPLVVFTNDRGNIIQSYDDGYSAKNIEKFSDFIESYFKKSE